MDRNLNIPESLLCQPARKFFCLVGVSVNKKDIFQLCSLDEPNYHRLLDVCTVFSVIHAKVARFAGDAVEWTVTS